MLKKLYCLECGGEIVFTYEKVNITFEIKDGKLQIRDSLRPNNELTFHCENDLGHDIYPSNNSKQHMLFMKWCEMVENHFYENSLWRVLI